jgi:hypothetical protein
LLDIYNITHWFGRQVKLWKYFEIYLTADTYTYGTGGTSYADKRRFIS